MSHTRSRKSAEAVLRWKTCSEIPLPFIASLFLAIFAVKISWAGLACLSNPCKYGICIDDVNGTFLCYCIDGYTGLLCQTNWDECWSNPCQNGGTCVDGIAHYNCTCPQGYQGEFCEQNIDECYSNPCYNNGTCIDGPNGYTCACPFGYVGNFCETDVSVCNDTHETRCLNGGLCTEGPGYTFNCTCPLGWEGKFCEESVDECISSPCENGGVCLDLQANYSCACPFGFSGRNCEVELEMCGDTSPCQNGAVCLVEDWLRVCYCVPDYHGDRCQFQYNECLLGPGCLNGGTCIDGVDGYDCSCNPGWSGNFCECWIINEDEMDCSYPFPPQITALTLPPTPTVQTVPIWIKTEVPKTTSAVQNIPEKATTPNYFYSLLTECRPVWPFVTIRPKHTTKSAAISTEKTTFFELFTQRTKDIEVTEKYTTKRLNTTQTIPMSAIQTTPMITKSSSATESTFKTSINATTISTTTKTMTQTTMAQTPLTPTTTQTTSTPQTTPTTTTTILTTTQTIPTTQTTLTTTQTTPYTIETILTTTEIIPKTNQTTLITTQTTPNITQTTLSATSPAITQTALTTTTPTTLVTEQNQTQVAQTTTEILKISKKDPEITLSTTKITPISTTPIKTTLPAVTEIETVKSTTQTTTISSSTTTTAIAITETTTKTFTSLTSTTPSGILKTTTECIDFTQTQQPLSTPMPWNCKKFPCLNGGTCLNTTNGIRCICKSNWEGPFCDGKVNIRLAGFSGSSYVSHRITNTHNIKINITARTVAPEGLILYSHLGPHIYMTLFMENGLLKFKFSCGIQTMLLSETQYNLNNGVDFIASITLNFIPPTKNPHHCIAAVRINNTLTMSGEQLAKGPHVDSGSAWIYIGGVPSRYVDREEAPVLKGFVGCIHNLKIDEKSSGIFKDSFDSNEVTECKSLACLSNPCKSGSSCIEYNETWTCLCPTGFLGRACDRSVCNNNPCQFGATCIPFPGSGFICLCPVGKQGLFCENDTSTGYPLFASSVGGLSSFAAYKLPTEIHQDMLLTFKFLPYDMEQISLMIFIGQEGYHRPTSDHLSVSFIKGYVVLTWNLGSGPRRIFTEHPVPNTGRFFHTVQIGRAGQRAWLAVDNQRNVTGRSPGKLSQLNTRSVVYLGGHDSKNFSLLPHDLPLHTGFSGCLFDVELRTGQMLIKIEKTPPAFSRGVGQCGRNLCNEHSCENGGGCIHHGATFTCLCSDGWFGPTCAMKYNPCDSSRHNCSEGSTCIPLKHGFECDCPVGKKGKFCEINEDLSDVKLTGKRSYIALAIEGLHPFQSCIDMEIRPLSNYGLILYSGRPEGNTFWSLSLQNGVLELRVFPGVHRRKGDLLVIRSRRLLTLGSWHRIRAGRYGRRLFLWVEGTVNTGVLLPGENLPPIGSLVYIGGVPDLSTIPTGVSGKVLTPFQGCLRKFTSQWKVIPLTKANILEGRNVEDCDGSVCGAEVCENGGTCYVNANNKPICTCMKHYTGSRCEIRMSCKEMRCQNGGRCAEIKSVTPQCFCPNGWSGPFCESGIAVKAPQFVGNSYLLIDRTDLLSNRRRDTQQKVEVSFINLTFMTAEQDGILLWSSKKTDTEFIGIGLENGKMKFVWAWKEQNTTTMISKEQMADGGWHDLAISFDTNNITVMIDQQLAYMSNENYPGYPITTDGRFFLGGFPDSREVINETRGYFSNGFNGCLKKLAWEMEFSILNFSNFEGENIHACDPFED